MGIALLPKIPAVAVHRERLYCAEPNRQHAAEPLHCVSVAARLFLLGGGAWAIRRRWSRGDRRSFFSCTSPAASHLPNRRVLAPGVHIAWPGLFCSLLFRKPRQARKIGNRPKAGRAFI